MNPRIKYAELAPEGARALRAVREYVSGCGLPTALVDLVYLRISEINGCTYCIDLHSRDLMENGVSVQKVLLVQAWRETPALFDARERAALAWAESLTRVAETGAPDADYDAAAAVFSERELADLTIAIALMNAYNRLGVGLRMAPRITGATRH